MDNQLFQSILRKYIDNTISPSELRDLFTRIQLPENREDALRVIDDLLEGAGLAEPDKERGERIFQHVVTSGAPPVKWMQPRYWVAAASVALLTSVYLLIPKSTHRPKISAQTGVRPAANDARPAGHKALLTLGDGRTVDLGGGTADTVFQQGSVLRAGERGVVYQPSGSPGPITYNTVMTPRGAVYDVVLPDGSKASLNAGSSLRFPTAFSGPERRVSVTGEVYFNIKPDQNKPFSVETGGITVRVLGTEFDVRAYPDETGTKATLISGKIRVGRDASSVVLRPGQEALLGATGSPISVTEADLDATLAWRNGWFQFNSADLATVMREMARWYDVQTSFSGKMPAWHFSGAIQRDIPLSQVLKMLESKDVHFNIEGNTINIKSQKW